MTSLRLCAATVSLAALVACSTPSLAAAAGEPQITSAGIDAQDRLVATWVLAPGTTFDSVEFATVPIPSLLEMAFFADGNFAGFECAGEDFCDGTPTMTSYTGLDVPRDRRYYVKVVAIGADEKMLTSAVWEIDETKPVIPGRIRRATAAPTNTPVTGRPYVPPAPETIPAPTLTLIAPPKRIVTVLQRGIRARVDCPGAECFALAGLVLGSVALAADTDTLRAGARRTFVLKASPRSERRRLARRVRARLLITVEIVQPGGKTTRLLRTARVRR
ncbi:MAG: hypothetical protein QOJ46_568 [bacterium]